MGVTPTLKKIWHIAIELGFALLCLRFLVAAVSQSGGIALVLGTAGLLLAWWRPAVGLCLPVLTFSLLGGLDRTLLVLPASSLLVVASSVWLGLRLHQLSSHGRAYLAPAGTLPKSALLAGWSNLVIHVLAGLAFTHITLQIWQEPATPDFWPRFWHQPAYAPGDPLRFLTTGFQWLHGLFYFRALREPSATTLTSSGGIKLVLGVNGGIALLFFATQLLLEFPARWTPGYQAPYEDIATFGVMATCLLIFSLSMFRTSPWPMLLFHGLAVLFSLTAVAISWSRGTWLANFVSLSLLAAFRLPRCVTLVAIGALLGTIAILNFRTTPISPSEHPYLSRLASLTQLESPTAKSSGRIDLYHKGWAMIREHPWAGHGIGTFYRKALSYANPSDASSQLPQLPHNMILQLAVEQGVPCVLLFISLVGFILASGLQQWATSARAKTGRSAAQPGDIRAPAILTLTLVLMIAAYIQTNLTWDMLLEHPSQTFFFWFLLAALLTQTDRAASAKPGTVRA